MMMKKHHPGVVLFYYGSVLVLTMATRHPAVTLLSFLFSLILRFRMEETRKVGHSLFYLLPMILMITVLNGLYSDRGMTLLFSWGPVNLSVEGILYGLISGISLSAVILWFQNYHDTMESGRFLAVLGKRLPVISMMVSMIFRAIPDTLEQGREIEQSRRALTGERRGKFQLKHGVTLLTILMGWSMENAIETADAMKAKAYLSDKRIPYAGIRRSLRDLLPLLLTLGSGALVLGGVFIGGAGFLYYPFMQIPQRAERGFFLWLTGSTLLFLLPLFLDALDWALGQLRRQLLREVSPDPFVLQLLPHDLKAGVE